MGDVVDRCHEVDWRVKGEMAKMWCRLDMRNSKNPRWEAILTFEDHTVRVSSLRLCSCSGSSGKASEWSVVIIVSDLNQLSIK